jgi:hypothetical protein
MLLSATSCTAVAWAVTLAVAPFGQLELDAEGLALAVNEVSEIAAGAVGWLVIAERLFSTLPHARMGPAEADDAQCLGLFGCSAAKGMSGRR